MGKKQSKVAIKQSQKSHIVLAMEKRYGAKALECLSIWTSSFGFPEGGSFSINQLRMLKEKLDQEKERVLALKKVNSDDVRAIFKHQSCLAMWEEMALERDRKKHNKILAPLSSEGETCTQADTNTNTNTNTELPPPYRPNIDTNPFTQSVELHAPYAPKKGATLRNEQTTVLPSFSLYPDLTRLSSTPSLNEASPCLRSPAPLPPLTAARRPLPSPVASAESHPEVDSITTTEEDVTPEVLNRLASTTANNKPQYVNTFPMIEMVGSEGPELVFRPWGPAEFLSASQLLSTRPETNCSKFREDLLAFCREYKPSGAECARVLVYKLSPADFEKFKPFLPDPALRAKDIVESDSGLYMSAIKRMCDGLAEVFPRKYDLNILSRCKQEPGERVEDYFCRLRAVFDEHSGVSEKIPAPAGGEEKDNPVYNGYLCSRFIEGLLPEVAVKVRDSYVAFDNGPEIRELVRYAKHASFCLETAKIQATLVSLENHTAHTNELSRRGWGYNYRQQGHHGYPTASSECWNCGQFGHMARECRDPPHGHSPQRWPQNDSARYHPD